MIDDPRKRMPRAIRIVGQRYKVQQQANLHVQDHNDEAPTGVDGLMDTTHQIMMIDPTIGSDRLREVFLHESLHAMVNAAGLHRDILEGRDEQVIKRLAPILLDFLKANPQVYTYLTGRRFW